MERKGLFHRSSASGPSLPLASTKLNIMLPNNASRRRQHNSIAFWSLLIIAAITIFVVVLISFAKLLSAKTALKSALKLSSTASCHGREQTWHGGHPAQDRPGSCWCGGDEYCMCTPSLAIDIVLYSKSGGQYNVWVVRRKDTEQLATIGGFVDVGETTESAVIREAEEETGIMIPPEQAKEAMKLIGVYSDPRRDNRRSIVSVAYALEFHSATKTKDGTNVPKAGDDAKEVISVPLVEVGIKYKGVDWYADHLTILLDFKEQILKGDRAVARDGELYDDVARSTCSSLL